MSGFTKGNWFVRDSTKGWIDVVSDELGLICTIYGSIDGKTDLSLMPDAHLIAAAPKMYDLLNEWLESGYMKRSDVETVLAEARGEV